MDIKHKVLVVDDVEINRDLLSDILEDYYDILEAEDGIEALEVVKENADDLSLILLDLMMPKLDGFGVLEELNKEGLTEKIPVIVITGDDDDDNIARCSKYGIVDYIRKPFNINVVKLRANNSITLYESKNNLQKTVDRQTKEIKEKYESLKLVLNKTVGMLGAVVDYKDEGSGEHIHRIQMFTNVFAKKMKELYPEYNLDEEKIETITQASLLHDLGKISVPDNVLLKNGRLNDEEYNIIKKHTVDGEAILKMMEGVWEEDFLQTAKDICRHHHERYDGRGYPDKLVGDEIPISAQIVAVADVYDALINERPYKKAFTHEKAYEMIMNGECGTFSPKILDCFSKVKDEFKALFNNKNKAAV